MLFHQVLKQKMLFQKHALLVPVTLQIIKQLILIGAQYTQILGLIDLLDCVVSKKNGLWLSWQGGRVVCFLINVAVYVVVGRGSRRPCIQASIDSGTSPGCLSRKQTDDRAAQNTHRYLQKKKRTMKPPLKYADWMWTTCAVIWIILKLFDESHVWKGSTNVCVEWSCYINDHTFFLIHSDVNCYFVSSQILQIRVMCCPSYINKV